MEFYIPSTEVAASRTRMYKHLDDMIMLKQEAKPHFAGPEGPRSWMRMIDDAEKILNGFTLSREDQGKEDWQSNMMDNITRAKMRAIAAGIGLKVPDMSFDAVNDEGLRSAIHATLFKNITKQSYLDGNPTLYAFRQVWHMLGHGVVFEYEGYKTGGAFQDVIESFDSLTGKVKTRREYRQMDGKPFHIILNPQEFYWWTFQVQDIQDQPRIAWVQHYTRRELEIEFSKFPNYKFAHDKRETNRLRMEESTYFSAWKNRVSEEDDYEVIRMFSKADDGGEDEDGNATYGYEIWCNGVPFLQAPLLWGDKVKVYPFAKQIPEHYANTNYFVGIPFPILMEAYQDQKNTIINTLVDKLYRSVDPLKLVGLQNKDLLDVEASIHGQDNTVYVPDINAVKFMPNPNINQGELAMLAIIDQGINLQSVDPSQQGITSGPRQTATAENIADKRAEQLKSTLFVSLEDLWYQKTKLRVEIILTHFLKDKASQTTIKGNTITITDFSFGDGGRGTLDIHIAKTNKQLLSLAEIDAREQAAEQQGIAYKLISIPVDYLDDWSYDFKIVPQSFSQQNKQADEQALMSEVTQVTTLFPEFFMANKDKYLERILLLHGKHPDEYNPPAPPPPMGPGGPGGGQPGQPGGQPQPQPQGASILGL